MKKQERRKEKGITLVALVVTIIVLIILAGVTLNIVLDNDGIINKAKQAVGDYENSQREEQEMLGEIENYMNNLGTGGGRRRYNICRRRTYSKWLYSLTNKYRRFRSRRISNI